MPDTQWLDGRRHLVTERSATDEHCTPLDLRYGSVEQTGGEAVCQNAGVGGRQPLNRQL
jgi:hypothetical protein